MPKWLYNWIDRRGRIPRWVYWIWPGIHWCDELDYALIVFKEECLDCFSDIA